MPIFGCFKLITATALMTVALSIFAGGDDVAPAYEDDTIAPPQMPPTGFYVGADIGYASRHWGDVVNLANVSTTHQNGGFTFGLNAGYQFTRVFSGELGWFYLPELSVTSNSALVNKISSWLFYFALKGAVPIHTRLYLFGKIGLAYTHNSNSTPLVVASVINADTSNYWVPYFAGGLQYDFTNNFSVNAQLGYLPGAQVAVISPKQFPTPNAYLILCGGAYKFY